MKYLFFYPMFFLSLLTFSQEVYVVGIKGEVSLLTNSDKKKLAINDKINIADTIQFSSSSDLIVAISEAGAKYVIKPTVDESKKKEGEFISLIRQNILPVTARASSRDASDFIGFLNQNRFIHLINRDIRIKEEQGIQLFFYWKKDFVEAKTKNSFYVIPSERAIGNNLRVKVDGDNNSSELDILLVEVKGTVLVDELRLLKNSINHQSDTEELLRGYVFDNYGYLSEPSFAEVLKQL